MNRLVRARIATAARWMALRLEAMARALAGDAPPVAPEAAPWPPETEGGPPAHWVEKVRLAAPDLLAPAPRWATPPTPPPGRPRGNPIREVDEAGGDQARPAPRLPPGRGEHRTEHLPSPTPATGSGQRGAIGAAPGGALAASRRGDRDSPSARPVSGPGGATASVERGDRERLLERLRRVSPLSGVTARAVKVMDDHWPVTDADLPGRGGPPSPSTGEAAFPGAPRPGARGEPPPPSLARARAAADQGAGRVAVAVARPEAPHLDAQRSQAAAAARDAASPLEWTSPQGEAQRQAAAAPSQSGWPDLPPIAEPGGDPEAILRLLERRARLDREQMGGRWNG